MAVAEQRRPHELSRPVERALWLFENAAPPEPIRQYARDKMIAVYLFSGGNSEVRPKKLLMEARKILEEVVFASYGTDPALSPGYILASQSALKGDWEGAESALDGLKGRLYRGIRAMSLLTSISEEYFRSGGRTFEKLDAALITLANELRERGIKSDDQAVSQKGDLIDIVAAPVVESQNGSESRSKSIGQSSASVPMEVFKPITRSLGVTQVRPERPSIREAPQVKRNRIGEEIIELSDDEKLAIGRYLRSLRIQHGLRLEDVLGHGSNAKLSSIERGVHPYPITRALLERLALKLGISLTKILSEGKSFKEETGKTVPIKQTQQPRGPLKGGPETDVENIAANYLKMIEDLRQKVIDRLKDLGLGERFLFEENGREYSLVQDGRVRVRILKTGQMWIERLGETSNSRVVSAAQKFINRR